MSNRESANIIKVACIYTASVVGAGFASGQELLGFFVVYRKHGFLGIIIAGVLFAVMGFLVLDKVFTYRIKDYREFVYPMTGLLAGRIVEIIGCFFMASVFCVMVAGSGKIVSKALGTSVLTGVLIMAALCAFTLLCDIKGVVALSTFLTPVLIIGIIFSSVFAIISHYLPVYSDSFAKSPSPGWLASSILYVSYNSIVSLTVMASLLPYLKTRRVARAGGVLGGLMLCFMALAASFSLYLFMGTGKVTEFPMLEIVNSYSDTVAVIYAFILWLAMLLSAVTSGYCLTDRLSSLLKIKVPGYMAFIVCALAVPMSTMGFSRLIGILYPLFGCLGLFMVLVILIDGVKTFFERKKNNFTLS